MLENEIILEKIFMIIVSIRYGFLYILDNRCLWVFKKLEEFGKCESIKVKYGYINFKKFIIINYGILIFVRGDFGGSVWKMLRKYIVCLLFIEN